MKEKKIIIYNVNVGIYYILYSTTTTMLLLLLPIIYRGYNAMFTLQSVDQINSTVDQAQHCKLDRSTFTPTTCWQNMQRTHRQQHLIRIWPIMAA